MNSFFPYLGFFFVSVLLANPAFAKQAVPAAADPALEARMLAIAGELRCVVCQNQSVADSQAPLAADLRQEIREKLRAGAGEREVLQFMVARYGDFVLYRPPFKASTVLLWLGPFLFLLAGAGLLWRRVRRQARSPGPALSDEERARAARLLQTARE